MEFFDVRTRGFGRLTAVADVLALIDAKIGPLPAVSVPLGDLAGRVLAEPVVANCDVPSFARSAMDGYAVRAIETALAGPNVPVALTVIGDARPGDGFAGTVGPGQAVRVRTGAPLPTGADAVVRYEGTRDIADDRVLIEEAVAVGRNVGRVGEDVPAGWELLQTGRILRPQDVGLLAAIGEASAWVVRRPRVAILVTGPELLPPGTPPTGHRIVDSNSPMLAALITRDGGDPLPSVYLPDDFDAIRTAIASTDADLILISGGSSVGPEDHAPRAVAALGNLAIHGVALRPAKPVGLGFVPQPIVLLPGNPVSCLCAYDLFAGRIVRHLAARPPELPYFQESLLLDSDIVSAPGRVDYVRVSITPEGVVPLATTGAAILSSTVIADGFVLVGHDRERLGAGEIVEVWRYC